MDSSELFWNKLEGYVRSRKLSGGRCELLDFLEVYFDSILLLKYKLILAVYLSCSWLRLSRLAVATGFVLITIYAW